MVEVEMGSMNPRWDDKDTQRFPTMPEARAHVAQLLRNEVASTDWGTPEETATEEKPRLQLADLLEAEHVKIVPPYQSFIRFELGEQSYEPIYITFRTL